jgi:hypothetical protein
MSGRALELARILDSLGVPPDASRRPCREILRKHGVPAKTSDLAEAVKFRRAGGDSGGDHGLGQNPGTAWGQGGQIASDLGGPSGDHNSSGEGTNVPLFRGDHWPAPDENNNWQRWWDLCTKAAKAKAGSAYTDARKVTG